MAATAIAEHNSCCPIPRSIGADDGPLQRDCGPNRVMLQTRPRNRLLAALPETEWDLLRPCLTSVELKPRQVLQHPHTPVEYAYFVERGAVTFQARTDADGPVGVGLVDGGAIIGIPIILGTMRSYLR